MSIGAGELAHRTHEQRRQTGRGRAVSKEKFHLAIPAAACTVAHAFDAGIGEVPRHAANPRAV